MIMTAHIQYSYWDNQNIATYSPYILKKILRHKLQYQGLIMSDDLMMKANDLCVKLKLADRDDRIAVFDSICAKGEV